MDVFEKTKMLRLATETYLQYLLNQLHRTWHFLYKMSTQGIQQQYIDLPQQHCPQVIPQQHLDHDHEPLEI